MALKISVLREYTIRCDICGQDEFIHSCDGTYKPDDTPSRYFKRQGWREKNGETVCRDCASVKK